MRIKEYNIYISIFYEYNHFAFFLQLESENRNLTEFIENTKIKRGNLENMFLINQTQIAKMQKQLRNYKSKNIFFTKFLNNK